MKTIRITLVKEGAQATCTHRYHFTDWPIDTTWAGNHGAFIMPSGSLIACMSGIDKLERVVAFQANLCGATYKIDDLGGEAATWIDDVIFPPSIP